MFPNWLLFRGYYKKTIGGIIIKRKGERVHEYAPQENRELIFNFNDVSLLYGIREKPLVYKYYPLFLIPIYEMSRAFHQEARFISSFVGRECFSERFLIFESVFFVSLGENLVTLLCLIVVGVE